MNEMIVVQKHCLMGLGYVGGNGDEFLNQSIKIVAIVKNRKEGEKYVKGWTKNSYGNYEVGDDNDWYERTFMTIGEEWYH